MTINGKPYTIRYPKSHSIDYMIQELYVKRVYPFLPFLLTREGVVLDIGANIGCACILFRAIYPNATIFAFEPDRQTFGFLESNTASLTNVRIFNYGLYSRDCTAKLYQGRGTSTTNSIGGSMHNSTEYEEIALRRISSFVADNTIGRIVLLKIDTEGAEVPILQDIEHVLDRVDSVCLEYHSERDRLEIDRLLSSRFVLFNASVSLVHRGELTYVAKEIIATHTDLNKYEIARPIVP